MRLITTKVDVVAPKRADRAGRSRAAVRLVADGVHAGYRLQAFVRAVPQDAGWTVHRCAFRLTGGHVMPGNTFNARLVSAGRIIHVFDSTGDVVNDGRWYVHEHETRVPEGGLTHARFEARFEVPGIARLARSTVRELRMARDRNAGACIGARARRSDHVERESPRAEGRSPAACSPNWRAATACSGDGGSNPRPSSRTPTSSPPPGRDTRTSTRVASVCLTTFASSSRSTAMTVTSSIPTVSGATSTVVGSRRAARHGRRAPRPRRPDPRSRGRGDRDRRSRPAAPHQRVERGDRFDERGVVAAVACGRERAQRVGDVLCDAVVEGVGDLAPLARFDPDELRGERRSPSRVLDDETVQADQDRAEGDGADGGEGELGDRDVVQRQAACYYYVARDRRQRPQRGLSGSRDERDEKRDRDVGEYQRRLRATGEVCRAPDETEVNKPEAPPVQQRLRPPPCRERDERERVARAERAGGIVDALVDPGRVVRRERDAHEAQPDRSEAAHAVQQPAGKRRRIPLGRMRRPLPADSHQTPAQGFGDERRAALDAEASPSCA